MEKLPTNKRKATLLKTWKRRYFQAKNGNLIYYEVRAQTRDVVLSGWRSQCTTIYHLIDRFC